MVKSDKNAVELLAPAQNLNTAKCAIIYGADAVYIGASSFGARKNAANNLDDIKELIQFAHKYNVKIYITINTILDDNELSEARKLIFQLYEIGADAIIFQDMGLLEIELPPIELHASTQCNIRTKEKVEFFEKIGIKRAILARELSFEQIKEIRKNTTIELETFIHGALCVSYSGQCYMSANIGGRSANRGECAQACRMKYSLEDEKGNSLLKDKYLLCLKDFSAEKYIDKLVSLGVKSFKIEGRLKDENYVKNCVLYYRHLFDKYDKTSSGIIVSDFKPDINKTFNRRYTTYFLSGKDDNISNFDTPKSTGEYLGLSGKSYKDGFEIITDKEIMAGDGLCFMSANELKGCFVNSVFNNKIIPNNKVQIQKGTKIYRNYNIKFENVLKNSKTKRLIKVSISVFKDDILIKDTDNNEFILSYSFNEFADNSEKMKNNFIKSFSKTGDSIFLTENVEFKIKEIPFLPVSKLNELRRELFSGLENKRLQNYKTNEFTKTGYAPYPSENNDYRLNIRNEKAADFYRKCGIQNIEYALEKTHDFKDKELMRCKHCIRRALNLCLKNGAAKTKLFLVDSNKRKFLLEFDCKNCEMVVRSSF